MHYDPWICQATNIEKPRLRENVSETKECRNANEILIRWTRTTKRFPNISTELFHTENESITIANYTYTHTTVTYAWIEHMCEDKVQKVISQRMHFTYSPNSIMVWESMASERSILALAEKKLVQFTNSSSTASTCSSLNSSLLSLQNKTFFSYFLCAYEKFCSTKTLSSRSRMF